MMQCDVAIVGDGPAGCALALRLAISGYKTHIFGKDRSSAIPYVQGISKRTIEALMIIRAQRTIATVAPPVPRLIDWNGELNSPNSEYIIDRPHFDNELIEDARAWGVRVTPITKLATSFNQRNAYVTAQDLNGASIDVSAKYLVEARGRQSPAPFLSRIRGPQTIALASNWKTKDNARASCVASFENGWGWYAANGNGRATLQFFVDKELIRSSGKKNLAALYQSCLSQTPLLARQVTDAEVDGELFTCGAELCLTGPFISDTAIRIGDAALSPDPLSGHGIYEALSGSITAAAVINAALTEDGDRALAIQFYTQRMTARFARATKTTRASYESEKRWQKSTFWAQRSTWEWKDDDRHSNDANKPYFRDEPVISYNKIINAPTLVTSENSRGVWRVYDVPLKELHDLLLANPQTPLGEIAELMGQSINRVLGAYKWLISEGVIDDPQRTAIRTND